MQFLKVSALMMVMLASAILMLGVLSTRGIPARGGSVPAATSNGDVNCDGVVDISDAIGIIQHAFYGGPAPCALALDGYATKDDLAALSARVDLIANQAFPLPGRKSEGRFMDNGDGTVTDSITGLQWQKATADANGDGLIDENDRSLFADAVAYTTNSTLGGHADWRLPNPVELASLIDHAFFNPAMDPLFSAQTSDAYWSGDGDHGVNYYFGETIGTGGGAHILYVRLVRNP